MVIFSRLPTLFLILIPIAIGTQLLIPLGDLNAQATHDEFFQAVKSLEPLNYTIRSQEGCDYLETSTLGCRMEPNHNWINTRVGYFESLWKESYPERIPSRIDENHICRIRNFFLKSTEETQPGSNLYVRFNIEQWKCKSVDGAKSILKELNGYSDMSWERLDKSPTTLWRDGDSIYFIRIGGWYVLPFVETIQNHLMDFLADTP